MNVERYHQLVFERIAKGHFVVRRKAVPKKKSPTGRAVPAVKDQVEGVITKLLLNKTMQNKMGREADEQILEAELMRMRKAGLIVCTNGIWWRPKAK
jgi:hypothetical protein